jgi:hypothetical protein
VLWRSVVPVAALRGGGADRQRRRGAARHRCQAAVETVLRGGAIGPLPEQELGGGTAKRNAGWSTFSTAKRVRTEASCDLGLCLNPGTPSMSSDDSITTTGGGDKDEPLLLDLFV